MAITSVAASAEPTEIVVRVISQDAKFVGDSMGGARVTLREARTGRLLAKGKTTGGTGDTKRIMQSSGRSPARATPDAAAFRATVNLAGPTLVDLEVAGAAQSAVRIISQRWLMPGTSVTAGDGWTVELPGLAITPAITMRSGLIVVDAKVELMCGCPITPGGMWDAADYVVEASLWRGERRLAIGPLAFTTVPGHFGGIIEASGGAGIRLVVFARNKKTGNSGFVEIPVKSH